MDVNWNSFIYSKKILLWFHFTCVFLQSFFKQLIFLNSFMEFIFLIKTFLIRRRYDCEAFQLFKYFPFKMCLRIKNETKEKKMTFVFSYEKSDNDKIHTLISCCVEINDTNFSFNFIYIFIFVDSGLNKTKFTSNIFVQ